MARALALVALLGAAPTFGAQVEPIAVSYSKGLFTVDATMTLQAPLAAVHGALTDYAHLSSLSPAIIESRVVSRDAAAVVVFTRSRSCVGWFCRELRKTERVTESSDTIVAVADPAQSNVERGLARWKVSAVGDATRVDWHLEVDPAFFVPPLIGPPLVKSAMKREGQTLAVGIEKAARAIAKLPPLAAPAAGRG